MSAAMENQLFNLKLTAKQLHRQSKKCEKQVRLEKLKLRKCIETGNRDGARIHAENAIRNQNLRQNYIRLASRIEAAAARVETAVRMGQVTRAMCGVVTGMDKATKTMDLERIGLVMDQFEKQFDNLDVQSSYMEERIGSSTALSTPTEEVDSLISQVADEHGLDLQMQLGASIPSALPVAAVPTAAVTSSQTDEDKLLERLAALRSF